MAEEVITKLEQRSYGQLADTVCAELNIPELELNKLYEISRLKWTVMNHEGDQVGILGLIRKSSKTIKFGFDSGDNIEVATHHMFATDDRSDVVVACEMSIGDKLTKSTGDVVTVIGMDWSEEAKDVFDIQVASRKMLYQDSTGLVHHNTHTVEEALNGLGLEDGAGYFKNTSSGSPAGLYRTLFQNRTGIVVLDDSDTIVDTQEGRNLLKAALDTKKVRKLVWGKSASWLFDPADEYEMEKALQAVAAGEEPESYPRYFNFEGRVIVISNLPLEKLDPDGALGTRGFIITLNPTQEEVVAFMRKIAPDLKVEGEISLEDRMKVVDLIEKQGGNMNLRKLVRGINLAASGTPGWERLIERYC